VLGVGRLAVVVVVGVIVTAFGTTSASPGKVVCPSADRFSCYYPSSDTPVRGPYTIDGHRVVGRLPSYCTQKTKRCVAGDTVAVFSDPETVTSPQPTGEYLEWSIRKCGRDSRLATYIPLAQEQTHEFGQLPKG
jgi:hypothetical protein